MTPGFINRCQHICIHSLRIALAITFIWFGALKMAGYNPVYDIVYSTYPLLAGVLGTYILGSLEVVIGLLLLCNCFYHIAHIALVGHLLGTLLVFITAPELMFIPHFPILSLNGEFVFKNIILALSGIVVFLHEAQQHCEIPSKK